MKLTAITCTYQRPAAFALCQRMMKRQTRQPDQWLVLDGPESMQQKVLAAIEAGRIEGEAIAFVEDDDWYRPDWLEWGERELARGFDIVGEGNAVYYHVGRRWWSECHNIRHAALCQTVVHREMLEIIANIVKSTDCPFIDVRLWAVEAGRKLFLPRTPAERHVVGIKGIRGVGGAFGYSGEHQATMPKGVHIDPSLMQLWKWIASDAANYSGFKYA